MMKLISACICVVAMAFTGQALSAEVFCSIEIGAKGVKARAYEIEESDEDLLVETHYSREINTHLVSSLKDGNYSTGAIKDAADAVATLMSEMKKLAPACRPIVVGSSSAAKAVNAKSLADEVGRRMETEFAFVTPDEEAYYGFIAAVQQKNYRNALLVDIGSGNTKIGYLGASEKKFFSMEIPYGSASLSKLAIEKNVEASVKAYDQFIKAEVSKDFSNTVQSMPAVQSRKRIYWIGGAAWATATWSHPEQSAKGIVMISERDINRFRSTLNEQGWVHAPALPDKITPKSRKAFEKDWAKVPEVFTRENLLAGTGIMRAILNDGAQRDAIFFSRNANWVYGYTLAKFMGR